MAAARISLSAIGLCVIASAAAGSPVDDPTTGRAVFTGATMPSAASIVLDPASLAAPGPLGTPEPDSIYVGLTSTLDNLHVTPSTLDLATGAQSPGGEVKSVVVSPGADVAVLYHPTSLLALGVQLRMPPGQQFLQDQPTLRYFTLGGYQRDIQASLALGVHVASPVWVGTSITIDDTLLRLRYAEDTALGHGDGPGGVTSACGNAPCGVGNPLADETFDVKVYQHSPFSDGYIVNLGGLFRLGREVWLAATYHTPPGGATTVENEFDGDVTVIRPPVQGGQTLHGGAAVFVSQPASVDGELRARLPDDLDLHVGGRWLNLSRESGYNVQLYGDLLPGAGIPEFTERPRGYHDTVSGWAGVEQVDTGERWRFGARLGFETSAIEADQTTPATIAPASATFDLGAQLRLSPNLVVQLSYGVQVFGSVTETASEYDPRDAISCVDGGYNYATPACAALRAGYAIDTADGTYWRLEQALRVGLRYDLP